MEIPLLPSALTAYPAADGVFALDTEIVAAAATLLQQLSPQATEGLSTAASTSSMAAQALQPLAAAVSPGAGAVAEFVSLTTAALDNQSQRVDVLEEYGRAAAAALQQLVGSSLAAESFQSRHYTTLNTGV